MATAILVTGCGGDSGTRADTTYDPRPSTSAPPSSEAATPTASRPELVPACQAVPRALVRRDLSRGQVAKRSGTRPTGDDVSQSTCDYDIDGRTAVLHVGVLVSRAAGQSPADAVRAQLLGDEPSVRLSGVGQAARFHHDSASDTLVTAKNVAGRQTVLILMASGMTTLPRWKSGLRRLAVKGIGTL